MIAGRDAPGQLLAVFKQFLRPAGTYRLLLDTGAAGMAMIASVIVISAAGYLPALLADWEEFETRWRSDRVPELLEEGVAPTAADSVVSEELEEIRRMTGSLPMAALVERGIIALTAALAAFGIVYAVEGRKVGRFADYVTSAVLSQSAYMITGAILMAAAFLFDLPPGTRLNLSVLVPTGTVDPSRLHVFMFRFLGSMDIPSLACLFLWGTGLSAMLERDRSWGLRLVFSVYILGIMLVSLPVIFAPGT